MTLHRARLDALADYLAAAVVISLPWSTSATSILVALWVIALAPTLDGVSFRRVAGMPAAALPVALVILALGSMLWADVPWPERLYGMDPFLKLLAIPLLLVHFSRTARPELALASFFASACALLALSWLLVLVPQLPWQVKSPGVPVKDYIIQSGIFTLCFFALLDRAIAVWGKSRAESLVCAGLGLIFISNIVFVALGRTSLVVIAVLFALLGIRHFKRRALAAFIAAGVGLGSVAWATSPYLRERVTHVVEELDTYSPNENETSAGIRVQFWKISLEIVRNAPLIGHGTGSTQAMFAQYAGIDPTAPTGATNPHNQILATAIPLGLSGVVLLLAMWIMQFRMFLPLGHRASIAAREPVTRIEPTGPAPARPDDKLTARLAPGFAGVQPGLRWLSPGQVAWIGISVVAQNFVGSLFNSHLFDFTQGWLYVFGVGVAGGIMLRKR